MGENLCGILFYFFPISRPFSRSIQAWKLFTLEVIYLFIFLLFWTPKHIQLNNCEDSISRSIGGGLCCRRRGQCRIRPIALQWTLGYNWERIFFFVLFCIFPLLDSMSRQSSIYHPPNHTPTFNNLFYCWAIQQLSYRQKNRTVLEFSFIESHWKHTHTNIHKRSCKYHRRHYQIFFGFYLFWIDSHKT